MSQINVNNIRAKDGASAVGFPGGINVTGVATATTFVGTLVGSLNGNADTATTAVTATNAQGLTGSPNITVGNIIAATASFSGNVSIAGTLTYNDVTNIDSIGIVTARDGLVADGFKVEEGKYNAAYSHSGIFAFNLEEGHVQEYTAATTANYAPNFRINSSTALSSQMDVGDVTAATLIVASSSHYCLNTLQVDGSAVGITTSWIGGSAPSAANGSGYDIYAFTIMKTSSTPTYHIIANATSAS